MYGPTAFSGVINIITKEPSDYLKNKESFSILANTGISSYNTKYIDVSSAYKKGNFSVSVTGRLYKSDRPDLSSQDLWDYDTSDYRDRIPLYNFPSFLNITTNAKQYIINNNIPPSPFYKIPDDSSEITIKLAGALEAIRLNQLIYDANGDFDYSAFVNTSKSYYLHAKINIADFSFGLASCNKHEGIGTTYTDYV